MAFKNGRNTRRAKRGLVPNYCEIPNCEFTALITKHRIKPGRKGGKYIPENVIGLCPNCHYLAESNYFTQYELFKIVQQRLKQESGKETMKICSKCGELKPLSEFTKNKQTPDGLRYECSECRNRYRRLNYKWDDDAKEGIYKWRRENPQKIKEYTRRHQLKKRYGLSEDDYAILFDQQNGVCAICSSSPNGKPLHVDHDHETGDVRGLLCQYCNHGVGNFKDDPILMKKAIEYISEGNNGCIT